MYSNGDGNLCALDKYLDAQERAEVAQEEFENKLERQGLVDDLEELRAKYNAIADEFGGYEFLSFNEWVANQ